MNPMDIEEKAENMIISKDLFERLLEEIPIPVSTLDEESATTTAKSID